jgi:hypothetical protein
VRAICAFLLRERRARVTGSDITRHVALLHRSKVEQVREAVSPVVNIGWLEPEGGDVRLARAWEVDQAIYTQFAERAAKARADAAQARELIRSNLGKNDSDAGVNPGNFYDFYCVRDTKCSETPSSSEEPTPPRARNRIRRSPTREAVLRHAMSSRIPIPSEEN